MTSREIVKTVLDKQIPERMGCHEDFWPDTLGNWAEQGYPKDAVPAEYFGFDLVAVGGWFNTELVPGRSEVVEETDEWQVTRDGRGASLKYWKNKSGTPEHIAFEVTTPEKWKEYREPLLEVDMSRLGDMDAQRKQLVEAKASGKFTVFDNMYVFELLRATVGDENFLPALLLEPEWIQDFCQVYLDMFIRHYEILFREVGIPDGFYMYEDLGYNKGLFCSPRVLADLIMPFEKKLVSFFKDYNLPIILHSCGNVTEAIPLIIDAGFDCLEPMEVKSGMNMLDLFDTFGTKLAYLGNIDARALASNDREKIKEEVLYKLNGVKERRIPYIFHSDHSIPTNVTFQSYEYALELFRENRWY